jgi:hypothetical protein
VRLIRRVIKERIPVFLSVITIGELRRGIELLRHRGHSRQAERLAEWLEVLLSEYRDFILDIDTGIAQLWSHLRVPYPENALDKQMAATALIYDLTVVTRNQADFRKTGVRVLNPFTESCTLGRSQNPKAEPPIACSQHVKITDRLVAPCYTHFFL